MQEWQQFYQMNPFGPWRDNFHAALITDMVAKVNGNDIPFKKHFYQSEDDRIEEKKAEDLKAFQEIQAMVMKRV